MRFAIRQIVYEKITEEVLAIATVSGPPRCGVQPIEPRPWAPGFIPDWSTFLGYALGIALVKDLSDCNNAPISLSSRLRASAAD